MGRSLLSSLKGQWPRGVAALLSALVLGAFPQVATAQSSTKVRYTVDRRSLIDGTKEELSHVNAIRAVPAGGVSFTELGRSVVRVFGADGKALASIGARGAGPGEFRMITDHGWIGDSLWVLDRQLRRTTIFHRNGTLLGTLPWPAYLARKETSGSGQQVREAPVPVRQLSGGNILMEIAFERTDPVAAGIPPGTEYALFETTPTGAIANVTIAASRRRVCESRWSDGNLSGAIPIPFCAHHVVAVSPNGRRMVLAEQGGRLGEGQVRLLVNNTHGMTQADISFALPVTRIPTRLMEAEIAKVRRGSALSTASLRRREAINRMPRAEVFPAFGAVLIADDGEVWLQRWTGTGTHDWVSVRPERGRTIALLELPPAFRPATLVSDGAWGTTLDADGVPSVMFVSRE